LGLTESAPAARRIGVFGGAFDPPHRGHVALAQTAIAQLQLDELRILPTGQAWHKTTVLSDARHRVAMAQLTFADNDRVVVDARETLRSGPTYTIDTLAELKAENPLAQLFLIIGEDQARSLTTWHRWQELADFAIICVAARGDSTGAAGTFDALTARLPVLVQLKMPLTPVSATEIRRKVASGQDIAPLVFDSVARYIAQHHLYQSA
jgi:nicotinate-nucleotide adenylyltransferase